MQNGMPVCTQNEEKNVKVIWDPDDIKPGRRFSKAGIKEKWSIGYISGMSAAARYVTVSDCDGMVTEPRTKEQMAQALTENGYLPIELL